MSEQTKDRTVYAVTSVKRRQRVLHGVGETVDEAQQIVFVLRQNAKRLESLSIERWQLGVPQVDYGCPVHPDGLLGCIMQSEPAYLAFCTAMERAKDDPETRAALQRDYDAWSLQQHKERRERDRVAEQRRRKRYERKRNVLFRCDEPESDHDPRDSDVVGPMC